MAISEYLRSGARFGAALRTIRARHGVRQWRLAHELYWNVGIVSHIERGERGVTDAERDCIYRALSLLTDLNKEEIQSSFEKELADTDIGY